MWDAVEADQPVLVVKSFNMPFTQPDADGVVQVRTVGGAAPVKQWRLPGPVTALAVDRRGEYLVTGNGNGTAYVLRLAGGR